MVSGGENKPPGEGIEVKNGPELVVRREKERGSPDPHRCGKDRDSMRVEGNIKREIGWVWKHLSGK